MRAAPRFNAADGRPLDIQGRCMFNVQLGSVKFQKELIVAAISDDVLLDADILHCDPEGPADLLLSEHKTVLKEENDSTLVIWHH